MGTDREPGYVVTIDSERRRSGRHLDDASTEQGCQRGSFRSVDEARDRSDLRRRVQQLAQLERLRRQDVALARSELEREALGRVEVVGEPQRRGGGQEQ